MSHAGFGNQISEPSCGLQQLTAAIQSDSGASGTCFVFVDSKNVWARGKHCTAD